VVFSTYKLRQLKCEKDEKDTFFLEFRRRKKTILCILSTTIIEFFYYLLFFIILLIILFLHLFIFHGFIKKNYIFFLFCNQDFNGFVKFLFQTWNTFSDTIYLVKYYISFMFFFLISAIFFKWQIKIKLNTLILYMVYTNVSHRFLL